MITLSIVLSVVACDRGKSTESAPETPKESATKPGSDDTHPSEPAEQENARPEVPAEPAKPEAPDYENAPATVKREGDVWMIVTDEETPAKICLPADTPADALEEGARVRFTIYLDAVGPGEPPPCVPAKTLVSIRRDD
jgi:hypothetical protein